MLSQVQLKSCPDGRSILGRAVHNWTAKLIRKRVKDLYGISIQSWLFHVELDPFDKQCPDQDYSQEPEVELQTISIHLDTSGFQHVVIFRVHASPQVLGGNVGPTATRDFQEARCAVEEVSGSRNTSLHQSIRVRGTSKVPLMALHQPAPGRPRTWSPHRLEKKRRRIPILNADSSEVVSNCPANQKDCRTPAQYSSKTGVVEAEIDPAFPWKNNGL